ncbi:MAG: CDP-alcohol phosphatidyltransferase family protein, partial [Angelakisella sp.]
GQIARKRGLVTDFGKFMDPLADKLLVISALVCFIEVLAIPAILVVLILAREFAVTALRTLAADNGVVIAADKWGKIKTVSQMCWISYSLLLLWVGPMQINLPWEAMYFLYYAGLAIVLVATVASGTNYLVKNRQLFLNSK